MNEILAQRMYLDGRLVHGVLPREITGWTQGCFETVLVLWDPDEGRFRVPLAEGHSRRLTRSLKWLGWGLGGGISDVDGNMDVDGNEGVELARIMDGHMSVELARIMDVHMSVELARIMEVLTEGVGRGAEAGRPGYYRVRLTVIPGTANKLQFAVTSSKIDWPAQPIRLFHSHPAAPQPNPKSNHCKLSSRTYYDQAYQLAQAAGFDDAFITINSDQPSTRQFVRETSIGNLMWSHSGHLFYPDNAVFPLHGVALETMLPLASAAGYKICSVCASLPDFLTADAVWMLNAVRGPVPIREISIDSKIHPFPVNHPDFLNVRELFESHIQSRS
jgi:branched-subunit amino acid aminotransferase/4-amino-4-deoxychorismate lyase